MKIFKEGEIKHLGLFYLHKGIDTSFAVIWIYWIVFLLDQGFSYAVIGAALAVNGLFMMLFEVPTGAIADAVSRKISVMLGIVGFGIGVMTIPFIEDPYLLILVFALWSLPITLISGATEAWVVDNLKHEDREDLIEEFYVKDASIGSFGFIIASLLSGLIVHFWDMDMLWFVYGISLIASTSILGFQKEHFQRKAAGLRERIHDTKVNVKKGARFTLDNRNVKYFMVAIFFIALGGEFILICRVPFLEVMEIPREYFGYIAAVGAALCVVSPFLAKSIASRFKKKSSYLALHTLIFGLIAAAVIFIITPELAILFIIVLSLRMSLSSPVAEPLFQGFLPSKVRATVGSFRNMIFASALLVGDVVLSLFADSTGPQFLIGIGGLLMLPAIVFFLIVGRVSNDEVLGEGVEPGDAIVVDGITTQSP